MILRAGTGGHLDTDARGSELPPACNFLKLCDICSCTLCLQAGAARVVASLCTFSVVHHDAFVSAGAIPYLVRLLKETDTLVQV